MTDNTAESYLEMGSNTGWNINGQHYGKELDDFGRGWLHDWMTLGNFVHDGQHYGNLPEDWSLGGLGLAEFFDELEGSL